jgi:cytochrome c oxidase cbb3-type subunit 3
MILNNPVKILLLGWLILQLSGCGDNPSETVTPPPEITPIPKTPLPPAPKKIAVTAETREVYQWYCSQCHGLKGKGDGVNAKLLTVPPRDHTKADYLETRTDQQLFNAIKQGGLAVGRAPCMPSWGNTLDEETIHSLVGYIRELCECEAF